MKRTCLLTLLLLPLLMLPMAASAWSAFGHRLVGALAATQLTPQAEARVAELLRGEKEPTLAGIAAWADELRANDPDLGKRSAKWHYLNVPDGTCDYVPERDCPNGDCIIGAIHQQTAILADRSRPRAERAQALKFVVHFIGDVHQPLHAGRGSDRGGNTVQVNLEGKGMNLHSLWDRELLAARGLDEAAYIAYLASLPRPKVPAGGVETWARESCEIISREGFYPPSAKLDPAYLQRWRPWAENRVLVASTRLARVLNESLGD